MEEQLKNNTFSIEILYFYNQHIINFLNSSKTMEEVTENIYCCDRGDKGYSFQIGDVNIAKLTDEQKEIATNKGWTLI